VLKIGILAEVNAAKWGTKTAGQMGLALLI